MKVIETPQIFAEVSAGELLDKLTILQIKFGRINDSSKLQNIAREMEAIGQTVNELGLLSSPKILELYGQLDDVNEELWDIENDLRALEAAGLPELGDEHSFSMECSVVQWRNLKQFISLARKVYVKNDRRAAIKKEINQEFGSRLVEEKSYASY